MSELVTAWPLDIEITVIVSVGPIRSMKRMAIDRTRHASSAGVRRLSSTSTMNRLSGGPSTAALGSGECLDRDRLVVFPDLEVRNRQVVNDLPFAIEHHDRNHDEVGGPQ